MLSCGRNNFGVHQSFVRFQEYLASPVQVKVGKVSSPTTNVSQTLVKISENEKVCLFTLKMKHICE